MARRIAIPIALLAGLLLCAPLLAGLIVDNRRVEARGAKLVKVNLHKQRGVLIVSGGAETLMDASFRFDREIWRPIVDYAVGTDKVGNLTVRQPTSFVTPPGEGQNEWDIRLSPDLPMDLFIDSSSGANVLDLGGIDLALFRLEGSSGKVDLSLPGRFPSMGKIRVTASSGNIDFDAPGDYPSLESIRIRSSSGSINFSLTGKTGSYVDLVTDSSSGETSLNFTGEYEKGANFLIDASSGPIKMDLTGKWKGDLTARIEASSSPVTVYLPVDVGLRVLASSSSGEVKADGFIANEDEYVNTQYGKSDVNLKLKITTSSGPIKLYLTE